MGGMPLEFSVEPPGKAVERVRLRQRANERFRIAGQTDCALIALRLVLLTVPRQRQQEPEPAHHPDRQHEKRRPAGQPRERRDKDAERDHGRRAEAQAPETCGGVVLEMGELVRADADDLVEVQSPEHRVREDHRRLAHRRQRDGVQDGAPAEVQDLELRLAQPTGVRHPRELRHQCLVPYGLRAEQPSQEFVIPHVPGEQHDTDSGPGKPIETASEPGHKRERSQRHPEPRQGDDRADRIREIGRQAPRLVVQRAAQRVGCGIARDDQQRECPEQIHRPAGIRPGHSGEDKEHHDREDEERTASSLKVEQALRKYGIVYRAFEGARRPPVEERWHERHERGQPGRSEHFE